MLRQSTPWIGLVALVAMFVLPFLPNWLFDGPRTIKHHPRRHICVDCGAPWTDDHDCTAPVAQVGERLRGELWRRNTSNNLAIRPTRRSEPDD